MRALYSDLDARDDVPDRRAVFPLHVVSQDSHVRLPQPIFNTREYYELRDDDESGAFSFPKLPHITIPKLNSESIKNAAQAAEALTNIGTGIAR